MRSLRVVLGVRPPSVLVMHKVSLKVLNSHTFAIRLIVEPWAREYDLPAGCTYEVVALNEVRPPTLGIELDESVAVVWIDEAGSWYELWENGARRDSA